MSLLNIDRAECLRLVGEHAVGRLGVVNGRQPLVFPINYALAGDEVVFRTDDGTKLTEATRGKVCFQLDAFDDAAQTGWSVLIQGRAEEISPYDHPAVQALKKLPVHPWAGGAKLHWFRIRPTAITGRRIP
jgi:nitroimidazol reductase NimA-like FMN-containing flavoprotein (pyridoxamine 5'-phosphate oxidase superfamily)